MFEKCREVSVGVQNVSTTTNGNLKSSDNPFRSPACENDCTNNAVRVRHLQDGIPILFQSLYMSHLFLELLMPFTECSFFSSATRSSQFRMLRASGNYYPDYQLIPDQRCIVSMCLFIFSSNPFSNAHYFRLLTWVHILSQHALAHAHLLMRTCHEFHTSNG